MLGKSENNHNYISIIGGKLAVKATADSPGAVARVNKVGNTVQEIFYDDISGTITGTEIKSNEYGDQLYMTIEREKKLVLQFPVKSSYFRTLITKLGNINLTKEVKIVPYAFDVEGKTRSGLSFYQNGVKIENYISKDFNPKGYPVFPTGGKKTDVDRFNLDFIDWSLKYLSEQTWTQVKSDVQSTVQNTCDSVDFDFTAESASVGECPF